MRKLTTRPRPSHQAAESARPEGLQLSGIHHAYGSSVALDRIDLDVARGEFVTLLGASGCGKSTLLRIIAGIVQPTRGTVMHQGRDLTGASPNRRPFTMVFQRPTLFPHLDVFSNVAFGLRLEGLDRRTVTKRVHEALELVHLPGMEKRRSHELSGGQMQRVALARALVKQPDVLLLDEPFSALDLAVRLDLEAELRRLHREAGATFVYVTHDQREALALSDRIAVFKAGRIEQIGTPAEVYQRPRTRYVARFVGDANLVSGRHVSAIPSAGPDSLLVLRAEDITLVAHDSSAAYLVGRVQDVAFRGTGYEYSVAVAGVERPFKVVSGPGSAGLAPDDTVGLTWSMDDPVLVPSA